MRQQIIFRQEPELIEEEDCDLGVEPLGRVQRYLDFVLDNTGWHPAVVLVRGLRKEVIVLGGLNIRRTQHLHTWRERSRILFLQQDPTFPDVIVSVCFRGHAFEQTTTTERLDYFLNFEYEQSVGDPPTILD